MIRAAIIITAVIAFAFLAEAVASLIWCVQRQKGRGNQEEENVFRSWMEYNHVTEEEIELFCELYKRECAIKAVAAAVVLAVSAMAFLWSITK